MSRLIIVVLLTALFSAILFVITTKPIDQAYPETTEIVKPQIVSAESRILFTGEVYWGRSYERNRRQAVEGALAFPFSGLASYDKDKYDAWVGMLECPITDEEVPFSEEWLAIRLNCRPEFLPEFTKWYDVVSLAGNHTNDVNGEVGYQSTKDYLDQFEVDYFGQFDPSVREDVCKVIGVDINLTYDDQSTSKAELPIAFCGYNSVFGLLNEAEISVISEFADKYFTVVMPQMGAEYQPSADQLKTQTYQAMVDAGADLVAASHPHWVQNTEVYKDKLIVYSLGNFIFDQNYNVDVRSSVSLDTTLSFTEPDQIEYIKSLVDKSDQVPAYVPDVEYDLIPGQMTDLVQSKLSDQVQIDRLMQRTNWPQTQKSLPQKK